MQLVKEERHTYREVCKTSKENLKATFCTGPPGPGSVIPPLSNKTAMHYSFDMAQQVNKVCTY